jgi:DNA-binding transcriptional regulator YdaS (Cro superfamily)
MDAFRRAVEIMGSRKALCEAIGVKPPSSYSWREVPPKRVIAIERATGGQVTRHELRPDLYPLDDEPAAREAA